MLCLMSQAASWNANYRKKQQKYFIQTSDHKKDMMQLNIVLSFYQ